MVSVTESVITTTFNIQITTAMFSVVGIPNIQVGAETKTLRTGAISCFRNINNWDVLCCRREKWAGKVKRRIRSGISNRLSPPTVRMSRAPTGIVCSSSEWALHAFLRQVAAVHRLIIVLIMNERRGGRADRVLYLPEQCGGFKTLGCVRIQQSAIAVLLSLSSTQRDALDFSRVERRRWLELHHQHPLHPVKPPSNLFFFISISGVSLHWIALKLSVVPLFHHIVLL